MIRAAALFFFSGALALVYEVRWQRRFALLFGGGARAAALVLAACFAGLGAFTQVHENSTHSFALIVALFVLALAAGAQGARVALGRGQAPAELIGSAWTVAAVLVAAGPWLFLRLTDGMDYLPRNDGSAESAVRLAMVAAAVLLLAVIAMGVAFPAVLEWAGRGRPSTLTEVVGRVLAANVMGCVAGALLGAFVLPRWIGTWRGMALYGAVLAVGAAWCLMRSPATGKRVALGAAVVVLMAAGAVDWPRVRIATSQGERLVALTEGADGIVFVVERPGSRRLKLNNHCVLSGEPPSWPWLVRS